VGIQVRGTYAQVVDYLGRLAAMKRLLIVDNLQLSAGSTGAATGGAASQSTGPFSGGDHLSATISARMFSSPSAAAAAALGATGAPVPSSAGSSAPASSSGGTSTLNNS
jgi:hypothetical protein